MCSTCTREVFIIIYTIGTRGLVEDGGGMCRGGDADYSIANIMILTVADEGMHKDVDVYGYEERVVALVNIGIQSGGAKRGGGAGVQVLHIHLHPKENSTPLWRGVVALEARQKCNHSDYALLPFIYLIINFLYFTYLLLLLFTYFFY